MLPSKDGPLSKLSLTTRSESRAGAVGEEGPSTPEHLFRHELDSLSLPRSFTASLFSPEEWQSTGVSGITLCSIPQRTGVPIQHASVNYRQIQDNLQLSKLSEVVLGLNLPFDRSGVKEILLLMLWGASPSESSSWELPAYKNVIVKPIG